MIEKKDLEADQEKEVIQEVLNAANDTNILKVVGIRAMFDLLRGNQTETEAHHHIQSIDRKLMILSNFLQENLSLHHPLAQYLENLDRHLQ